MSGLGFDNRLPKLIGSGKHAVIDYIHVATNIAAGVMFQRRGNMRAAWAAWALGGSVLANSLMTDYELGVFRLYSFKVHGALDYGVAAMSAAFPSILGITDTPEAKYFWGQGAGETGIAGISDYTDTSGSKRILESTGERYRVRKIA